MSIQIISIVIYILGFLIAFYYTTRDGEELWVVVIAAITWPMVLTLILVTGLLLGVWRLLGWLYEAIKGVA